MRYCPTCDEEYRDNVERCADDQTPLLSRAEWEQELARQGRAPLQVKALVAVATFDDRFEAAELARALADENFDVALVSSKAPTVGPLTSAVPAVWSIVVPLAERERAGQLLAEWRAALESSRAEAEAAAEAEEAAGTPTNER